MKLETGQRWKTRSGNIVNVVVAHAYLHALATDGNSYLYADESEDGIFYVFEADRPHGQDLVEMVDIPETVTISKKVYDALQKDSDFLSCLRNAGVDNWEWYSEAVREMYGEDDE